MTKQPATKTKALAKTADEIAARYTGKPAVDWDTLRDRVDHASDGDLDTLQLDMLTDMVAKRIERAST